MGRFVTLKKKGSKIWDAKSRVQKNRVIVIQKEKRQPGLFSFCFLQPIFWNLFFKFQTLKKYQVDLIN